jgi:diacylglycerol kinase family enzyme
VVSVITNPHSTRNRRRPDRASRLSAAVAGRGAVYATPSIDAIKPALRAMVASGAAYCVVDGGDGTFHHALRCARELAREDGLGDGDLPLLVPSGGGAINFLARHAGIRGEPEDVIRALCALPAAGCDVVEVDSIAVSGERPMPGGAVEHVATVGFAIAGGGIGENFMKKYNDTGQTGAWRVARIVGHTLASFGAGALGRRGGRGRAVRGRASYADEIFHPTFARVTVDGRELPFHQLTVLSLGSLTINVGGIFRFFPLAAERGKMQVMVGAPSPLGIIRAVPGMMRGEQLRGIAGYFEAACEEVTVEASGERLLDPLIDGEQYRGFRRIRYRIGDRVRVPRIGAARGPRGQRRSS